MLAQLPLISLFLVASVTGLPKEQASSPDPDLHFARLEAGAGLPSAETKSPSYIPVPSAATAPGGEAASTPVPYRLVAPPLDTPWTDKVGNNPWPQHPRPLLYREAWEPLNGIWTYQSAGNASLDSPPSQPLGREVLIPSCLESGISGIKESQKHMWFARPFSLPSGWEDGQRTLLHFEAVDYEATVFVNGVKVGFHRGGYFRFSFDITDNIDRDGQNQM